MSPPAPAGVAGADSWRSWASESSSLQEGQVPRPHSDQELRAGQQDVSSPFQLQDSARKDAQGHCALTTVSRSCTWRPAPGFRAAQQRARLPLSFLPRGPRGASRLGDAAAGPWEGPPCSGPAPVVPRGGPCPCGLERDLRPSPGSPVTRPRGREHVRPAAPLAPSRKQQAPAPLSRLQTLPYLGHLLGRTLVPALMSHLLGAEATAAPREDQGVRSPEASSRDALRDWLSGASVPAADPARPGAFFMGPKDRARCSCCGREPSRCAPRPRGRHRLGPDTGSPLAWGSWDSVDGQILGWLRPLAEEEEEEEEEEEAAVAAAVAAAAASALGPAFPEMGCPERRLASFSAWPPTAAVPPAQLAAAGFFHTGQRDKVACFFCYGGLQNWERGDDPWTEHAMWFPRCEFLLQAKGRDFVRSVQDSYLRPLGSWDAAEDPEDAAPAATSEPRGDWEWPAWRRVPAVRAVLRMGFVPGAVRQLVLRKYGRAGPCSVSASQLVADLLQDEERGRAGARAPVLGSPQPPTPRGEAQSEGPGEPGAPDAAEQLRRLQEERRCRVCLDRPVSIVFVPCGHLACAHCAPSLQLCPICRAPIGSRVRTFLS